MRTMEDRLLVNGHFHSWQKFSATSSFVLGAGLSAISLAAYITTGNPWVLSLAAVGLVTGSFLALVIFAPISIVLSGQGLTARYVRLIGERVVKWEDVSSIRAIRRRGGPLVPRFFSLWLLDHGGRKVTWLPLHISPAILDEIAKLLLSIQSSVEIRIEEKSLLLGQ